MCAVPELKSLKASRSATSVLDPRREVYTLAEVAEHCTEDDAWLVINEKVRCSYIAFIVTITGINRRVCHGRAAIDQRGPWFAHAPA